MQGARLRPAAPRRLWFAQRTAPVASAGETVRFAFAPARSTKLAWLIAFVVVLTASLPLSAQDYPWTPPPPPRTPPPAEPAEPPPAPADAPVQPEPEPAPEPPSMPQVDPAPAEPEPVPLPPQAPIDPPVDAAAPADPPADGSAPADSPDIAPAEDEPLSVTADDPAAYGPPPPDPEANEFGVSPIVILGKEVPPGTQDRLTWTTGQSFSGSVMETPVIVVHGVKPGPRLCLTAGVHGDELNGVEVVRRLAYKVEPDQLAGTVIAVPIVNLLGFSRGSRYLPDRRDLNRFFPGSPYGSSASRIAHSFFRAIVSNCDALVDFHTGSFDRANLPQVRGDLTLPAVVEFTRGFGATAVLHSPGSIGMLRRAATTQGIPAVTFEIGGPMRLQPEDIEHGVQAIETLMHKMGMSEQRRRWAEPQAVFYESRWVRVNHGGMLFSEVDLGERVAAGQRLGLVIDPVSNRPAEVHSPDAGRVIGMALNQLVLPGFAAYHIGVAASEEQVVTEAEQVAEPDDERFLEYDQLDQDGGAPARPAEPPPRDDEPVREPGDETGEPGGEQGGENP